VLCVFGVYRLLAAGQPLLGLLLTLLRRRVQRQRCYNCKEAVIWPTLQCNEFVAAVLFGYFGEILRFWVLFST
jgi:hypothetical protein